MDETLANDPVAATEPSSDSALDQIREEASSVKETEEGAASEEKETPPAWDPEAWKEHEEFKTWRDREIKTARREAHIEGQQREAGQRLQVKAALEQVNAGVNNVNRYLKKALDEGALDPDGFREIIAQNAPAWQGLSQWTQETQKQTVLHGALLGLSAAIEVIAKHPLVGDEKLLGTYADPQRGRIVREWTYDQGEDAISDFIQDVHKKIEANIADKHYKRGLADGRKGNVEAAKAEARNGAGPSTITGSASGGRPTLAQYAAASSEQRAKWREAGIEPLVK